MGAFAAFAVVAALVAFTLATISLVRPGRPLFRSRRYAAGGLAASLALFALAGPFVPTTATVPAETSVAAGPVPAGVIKAHGDLFTGKWIPVDTDSRGDRVYVEAESLVRVGDHREKADIGIVGQGNRQIKRITFDCTDPSYLEDGPAIGPTIDTTVDYLGTMPREEPHFSTRDYVCFRKRSAPESREPARSTLS